MVGVGFTSGHDNHKLDKINGQAGRPNRAADLFLLPISSSSSLFQHRQDDDEHPEVSQDKIRQRFYSKVMIFSATSVDRKILCEHLNKVPRLPSLRQREGFTAMTSWRNGGISSTVQQQEIKANPQHWYVSTSTRERLQRQDSYVLPGQ